VLVLVSHLDQQIALRRPCIDYRLVIRPGKFRRNR
jgi:hypothetical protein